MNDTQIARIAVDEGLLSSVELDRVRSAIPGEDVGLLTALVDNGLLRPTDIERIKRDRANKSISRVPGDIVETSHTRLVPQEVADAQRDARSAFGRYTLLEKIGSGGMGTIWKAWDNLLGRWAAIKMLHEDHARHDDHRERFLREARAAARLAHPNIVQVYEVGNQGDTVFIALEYVPGETLRNRISSRATGPELRRRIELVRQAAEGIGCAHEAGITHRDIKPENVLVLPTAKGGQSKVVDFGLAVDKTVVTRLTIAGDVFGTPSYMAPEQALGLQEIVGPPADVFAVGVILYEIVAGKLPFDAEQSAASVYATIHNDPVPLRKIAPKTHPDLETIVMKCLEKEATRRYQDAKELSSDLGRFMSGEPISARPISWFGKMKRRASRNPALAAALAAAILLPGALGGIFVWEDYSHDQTLLRDLDQATEIESQAAKNPRLLPSAKVLYESVLRDDPSNERAFAGLNRVGRAIAARDTTGDDGDEEAVALRRHSQLLLDARTWMKQPALLMAARERCELLAADFADKPGSLSARAAFRWRVGDPDGTLADLDVARHHWIESREERHLRVLALIELGRAAEAVPLIGADHASDDGTFVELAAVRLAQGRNDEAREAIARVRVPSAESRYVSARVAARLGNRERALKDYEESCAGDPAFLPAVFALSTALRDAGRRSESIHWARSAVEAAPTLTLPRLFLAELLRRDGDLTGALREADRAVEISQSPVLRVWRAQLRLAAGDPTGAEGLPRGLRLPD